MQVFQDRTCFPQTCLTAIRFVGGKRQLLEDVGIDRCCPFCILLRTCLSAGLWRRPSFLQCEPRPLRLTRSGDFRLVEASAAPLRTRLNDCVGFRSGSVESAEERLYGTVVLRRREYLPDCVREFLFDLRASVTPMSSPRCLYCRMTLCPTSKGNFNSLSATIDDRREWPQSMPDTEFVKSVGTSSIHPQLRYRR